MNATTINPASLRRLAASVITQAAQDLRHEDPAQRLAALRFFVDVRSPLDLWCACLARDVAQTRRAALALI